MIAGVDVRATNNKTNEAFTTKSNDEGSFVLADLPLGDYSVLISAPGFANLHLQVALSREAAASPHNATMQVALGDTRIDVHMTSVEAGLRCASWAGIPTSRYPTRTCP